MNAIMKVSVLLILPVFLFTGCRTTSAITSRKFNPEMRKFENVTYSRIFEGGGVLASDAVQIFISAEVKKTEVPIPPVYLQGLAADEPYYLWNKANILIYLNSIADHNSTIVVDSITYVKGSYEEQWISLPQTFKLIPDSTEKMELFGKAVSNDTGDMVIVVHYQINGTPKSKEIRARRVPVKELRQRKGKDWGYFWN